MLKNNFMERTMTSERVEKKEKNSYLISKNVIQLQKGFINLIVLLQCQ